MLRRTATFVAVAALIALPAVAEAQLVCAQQSSCSLQPTATLTIPTIVRMQVPSLTVTMDGSTITDISGGASVVAGPFGDVNVRANAAWNLTIAANAANWTYTPLGGATGGVRAANTLQYSINSGAFAAMSQTAATVATGAASNGQNVNVQFQATIPADYSDPANRPGSYALGLTLTLTAP
jgi:hypothetical protein